MDIKEFQNEFPSTKEEDLVTVDQLIRQDITNVIGETSGGYNDDKKLWDSDKFGRLNYILAHTIKKHCLDKQRVLDALNHWLQNRLLLKEAIKEELGLEK